MATLNLVTTFNNIKNKFDEIKTSEHFAVDPLFHYDHRDLTSYDERRDEYNRLYGKKGEKRNRFFDHLEKKEKKENKCDADDIMDTRCYGNLKGAIWTLIIVAILLTLIFLIFVVSKLFSGSQASSQKSLQMMPQTKVIVSGLAPEPVPGVVPEQKLNFFDRLVGSKPVSPPEQAPQPKADFMSRLMGAKQQSSRAAEKST
jgi:hypothetical protein